MGNINLVTDKDDGRSLGTGTSALLFIFMIVSVGYLGLFFYGNKLEADSEILSNEYKTQLDTFISGDSRKVLDFQNRLLISDDLLSKERNNNQDIGKIEELMITGVNLGSYKYDDVAKSITLDCYADNYEIIAKQILSFKSVDYFSFVLAGETKFDAKSSKINFPIVLTLK